MTKDEHNALLEKLLDPELEHSSRTEVLQELRTDYGKFHADFEDVSNKSTKLQSVNDDLIISNSQLFRKLGSIDDTAGKNKEEDTKNFSETVTVSAIEKGL